MSDVKIPEAPADIPQDVWHATGMEFDKLYDAEPDLDGGCEWAIRQMAARMVVAERERGWRRSDRAPLWSAPKPSGPPMSKGENMVESPTGTQKVRPNDKYTPLPRGPWRGVPMNSVRLQTIWLNKEPKPHLSSKGNKE